MGRTNVVSVHSQDDRLIWTFTIDQNTFGSSTKSRAETGSRRSPNTNDSQTVSDTDKRPLEKQHETRLRHQ